MLEDRMFRFKATTKYPKKIESVMQGGPWMSYAISSLTRGSFFCSEYMPHEHSWYLHTVFFTTTLITALLQQ